MEGTSDINLTVEDLIEDLPVRRKERDQSLQLENCNTMGSAAVFLSPENEWIEPNSSMRSPEVFTDTLEGKILLTCTSSNAGSEQPSARPCTINGPGVMVEELTLNNYKHSNLPTIGCSNRQEEIPINKGQWQYFYQLSGGLRIRSSSVDSVSKEPAMSNNGEIVENVCPPGLSFQNPQLGKRVDEDHPRNFEHLFNSGNCTVSGNAYASASGVIRTKLPPASGFSQFFVRNSLKGKAYVNRHLQTCEESNVMNLSHDSGGLAISDGGMASNVSWGSSVKAKDLSPSTGAGTGNGGISLREWLKPRYRNINKAESLYIFRQIMELVDSAHSKGVPLQVQPSYFRILPSDRVKYVGSWGPQICSELSVCVRNQDACYTVGHFKRKKLMKHGVHTSSVLPGKHQKLSENAKFTGRPTFAVKFGLERESLMDDSMNTPRTQSSDSELREGQTLYKDRKTQNVSGSPCLSDLLFRQLTSETVELEERWYSGPEQLTGKVCTLESNIYSLGVLLFELFCPFDSQEVHAAAMSDLHDRILPPLFLSENPKEAGFCLWLLHPEPSSRPRTREILQSDLIRKSQDFSADQSSLTFDDEDSETELLLHFLMSLREQKNKKASKLIEEIGCLEVDIKEVEKRHPLETELLPQIYMGVNAKDSSSNLLDILDDFHHYGPSCPERPSRAFVSHMNEKRLMRDIKQLENAYFSVRSKIEIPETDSIERSDKGVLKNQDNWPQIRDGNKWCTSEKHIDRLGALFNGICKYARFSKFEVHGILRNGDLLNSANVICSLSFDRDEDYFAAAGISKKIKVFEFGSLLDDTVDIHYPVVEMSSKSKFSCVCWNNYIKNYLASTDYDGLVQLWDASTGQGFSQYKEHQKRAWSVDFSQADPKKLASGSDDCSVKLWSINEVNCISTIRNVANVCCVQFSSHSSHLLTFGSADYKIYCYDLRNTRIPWCTLAGHGKAVSYVKFLDPCTLVSASTDNTLKIWDLNGTTSSGLSTNACSLTLSGHTNEKNFVGLSVSNGYIACGSETNEVFAYYKSLPMPITSHKFGSVDPISGLETLDDNGQFVSSVCWRGKSNMIVAANSNGSIKLLRML